MAYLPGSKSLNTEHLGSLIGRPGKGSTSIGGGDPMAHSMNHYGKKGPAALLGGPLPAGSTGVSPTAHPGMKTIRGGSMGKHVRKDGLGSGKTGMPAPANYQPVSEDTE